MHSVIDGYQLATVLSQAVCQRSPLCCITLRVSKGYRRASWTTAEERIPHGPQQQVIACEKGVCDSPVAFGAGVHWPIWCRRAFHLSVLECPGVTPICPTFTGRPTYTCQAVATVIVVCDPIHLAIRARTRSAPKPSLGRMSVNSISANHCACETDACAWSPQRHLTLA